MPHIARFVGRLNIGLLIASLGLAAHAQDICPRAEPRPWLASPTTGVRQHSFTRLAERVAVETLQLPSGTEVELSHQGCEYYVIVFAIRLSAPLPILAPRRTAIQQAARGLRELHALNQHGAFDLALAASALDAFAQNPDRLNEAQPVPADGESFLQTQMELEPSKPGDRWVRLKLYKGPL